LSIRTGTRFIVVSVVQFSRYGKLIELFYSNEPEIIKKGVENYEKMGMDSVYDETDRV
jgi:hypothetical protein